MNHAIKDSSDELPTAPAFEYFGWILRCLGECCSHHTSVCIFGPPSFPGDYASVSLSVAE